MRLTGDDTIHYMIVDTILKQFNVKYEDLSVDERKTLNGMLESLGDNQLTVEKIKEYIHTMKDAVEQELTITGNNNLQDAFLKARLRNYMLLEAFLSTPEKARIALEKSLSRLSK